RRFRPASDADWQAALATPVITFVGRANDPRKNVPLLLDAFQKLRRALPSARLRLVGEPGPPIADEGVEVVTPPPHLAAELRRAAIFVLPSRHEGFGIAVAEALAAGLPAVVTPCGGPEELVRLSGGGRVLTGFDPDEMADTVAALVEDPAAAAAARECGR